MTVFLDAATSTEPFSQEVRNYIDENIRILQQARLEKRNNASLEDIFKNRNPNLLRATRKIAFQLVSNCLDNYLLSADEIQFANFSRELSSYSARHSQQLLEPSAISELFAQDDLPLRIELLSAYDRAINRLTHQFLVELCDENGIIVWERFTEFLSSN